MQAYTYACIIISSRVIPDYHTYNTGRTDGSINYTVLSLCVYGVLSLSSVKVDDAVRFTMRALMSTYRAGATAGPLGLFGCFSALQQAIISPFLG